MNTALHLPLLTLSEGDKVECVRTGKRGKIVEVFHTRAHKRSKCPVTTWHWVKWKDKTKSWYKRFELRPI